MESENMHQDDGFKTTTDLINAYEHGIDELKAAVAAMTHAQLLARPIAGKWSTLEVVAHLAGTEIYMTDRIERMIALDRPLLLGVDERPYPQRLNYQAFDLETELNLFAALRRHAARVLRLQPPEAWERVAVHSDTGLLTLEELVLKNVRHVLHHLRFVAEKRAALKV
jgi:hypothetical protein